MSKKKKFDMNAPEAKALIDDIVHGTFVKEGTMVAFPTCFPGASIPIAVDESHITALDVTDDGIIYGGTSGKRTHLFVAMFHGVTGMVFDMGTVDGADHCPAICCTDDKFVACVNGPEGGRVITRKLQPLPFDLIQEWGFSRGPFHDAGPAVKDQPILHAVVDRKKKSVIGITPKNLFEVDVESSKVQTVGKITGRGRIALGSQGGIFGLDDEDHLWRYDSQWHKVKYKAVRLPEGSWYDAPLYWATDHRDGLLYTADGKGNLISYSEDYGVKGPLAQTPVAPVGPMAVTGDGRLFGFCGPELAKMFCYDPRTKKMTDIGVAVSVLERRRYGYTFGDAVTGRDGELVFGENDDLGHLWLYFPKIQDPRG